LIRGNPFTAVCERRFFVDENARQSRSAPGHPFLSPFSGQFILWLGSDFHSFRGPPNSTNPLSFSLLDPVSPPRFPQQVSRKCEALTLALPFFAAHFSQGFSLIYSGVFNDAPQKYVPCAWYRCPPSSLVHVLPKGILTHSPISDVLAIFQSNIPIACFPAYQIDNPLLAARGRGQASFLLFSLPLAPLFVYGGRRFFGLSVSYY